MKHVKALLIGVAVLAGAGVAAWHFWLREQAEFAQIASAYGAKMVCSCRFVAERPMESCLTDFTTDVSILRFNERNSTIRVSVPGGFIHSEASFSPGLGCTLVAS